MRELVSLLGGEVRVDSEVIAAPVHGVVPYGEARCRSATMVGREIVHGNQPRLRRRGAAVATAGSRCKPAPVEILRGPRIRGR